MTRTAGPDDAKAVRRTAKYLRRQDDILSAATLLLNRKGLKGMTRADVAAAIGIVESGVGYYFSSKEALATGCFHRAIAVRMAHIDKAAREATVDARIATLLRQHFEFRIRVSNGDQPEVAVFDDVRALGDPGVIAAYVALFRKARSLLIDADAPPRSRNWLNGRAHWLMQQLVWIDIWLSRYDVEGYHRVADRMTDLMINGLMAAGQTANPPCLGVSEVAAQGAVDPQEAFLAAATQLVNEQGYLGASVDKIVSRLSLTKGAFYHYIDTKDDLMAICFARSADLLRKTMMASEALPDLAGLRLMAAVVFLTTHQLVGDMPLLRAQTRSLPDNIAADVLQAYERRAVQFASILSDGVADGSARAIDVQISAQMIAATLNGASELAQWLPSPSTEATARDYANALFRGISN